MFNKKVNLILLISLFFAVVANAQESQDGSYVDDFLNQDVMDFIYTARPMIEVNYGIGYPGHNNITGNFAAVGSWDVKLGKSERKIYKGILLDLNERYIFGSYAGSAQQNYFDTDGDILTTAYKFGFGSRDGIGYGGSFLSVTPYVSQDFVWTKLSDYVIQNPGETYISGQTPDDNILNDYYGTFRFGDKSSYGVKLEFASIFQVNAFYETSIVYRRHLFWYWSGSFLVSQIGYNVLARFTDEIVDSSPVIGPIINFALKAGYLYGYYLLRKENMNWPFNPNGNEIPLTYDTINIGFTMVF